MGRRINHLRVLRLMSLSHRININWDDLRLCLAVAQYHSLSGAAEQLGLSHSTVQRRIKGLEQTLGTVLFRRTSVGYELNEAGQKLVAVATEFAPQLDSAISEISLDNSDMTGLLRIALPDVSSKPLMTHLQTLQQQFPGVTLCFEPCHDASVITAGQADIALVLTQDAPMGQRGTPIGNVGFAAYVHRDFQDQAIALNMPWLGLTEELSHSVIGKMEQPLRNKFSRVHLCSRFLLRSHGIEAGLGVGLLACAVGEQNPLLTRVSHVLLDPKLTLWLLHRREWVNNNKVMTFYSYLKGTLLQERKVISGETLEPLTHSI